MNDCLGRGMFVDVAYWRWPTIFNPCAEKLEDDPGSRMFMLCHVAIAVLLSSTKEKAGSNRVFLSVCVLKLVSKP